MDSIKRFETKENDLYSRIRELESLVKKSSLLSNSNIKADSYLAKNIEIQLNKPASIKEKSIKSPYDRQSLLSNKSRSDRSSTPGNFKRLLNQAADQLKDDAFVGQKTKLPQARKKSTNDRSFDPLVTAGFSNQHLVNRSEETKNIFDEMKKAVLKIVTECKSLRRDSKVVSSKLTNIEKVLEK